LSIPNQDSLAQSVAEEMKKVYKSELGPQPIPLTIPGEAISEEDVSFFLGGGFRGFLFTFLA